jgi:carbonic anhydrase/acetyltransferase-like protein (isoleucine patch superfamily)
MFMGCIIGDHTKLGINSTINTGCVVGTGSNLWGRDLISGYIPEFSWGEASLLQPYRIDAFLSTAQLVKQRRQLKLSNKERSL